MGIRNAAKALLIDHAKMLVNMNQNSAGDICYGLPNGAIYYDLPGGGQNQYETLQEAVIRECMEESGYTVAVDRLVAIYEEISMNERFRSEFEPYAHKVHFLFLCHLTDESMQFRSERDFDMLESVWIDLEDIRGIPLYPRIVHANLERILKSNEILYLGSERVA